MDMCKVKVIVHDYKAGKDVWFGPYRELEIHEKTIWSINDSGRKEELASLDAQGFWFVRDDNIGQSAYGQSIKVSVDAEIKTQGHGFDPWKYIKDCPCDECISAEKAVS